jgi:hypothetical protein
MKDPALTRLRIGEVPDAPVLADAALAGTEPLCRPIEAHITLARGPNLTYGLAHDNGWRLGSWRHAGTAPSQWRRSATVTTAIR